MSIFINLGWFSGGEKSGVVVKVRDIQMSVDDCFIDKFKMLFGILCSDNFLWLFAQQYESPLWLYKVEDDISKRILNNNDTMRQYFLNSSAITVN